MPLDLPRPAPVSASTGGMVAVAVVVAGQFLLALNLVGGWGGATDDRPVVAGRHPLHLYHASLGAGTFRERYESSCYDPAFQAGCPKTPVFDGGCRPAELALTVAGGRFSPRAYKLGLVAGCALGPLVFALAAWGAGCPPGGWVAGALLGTVVWWSEPVRVLLVNGNADLIGVGLAGLLFVGVLPRYAATPGLMSWALLAAAEAGGWYCHPVVWLGLFPVGFAYYAAVAPRHGLLWHLGQVAAFGAGLGPNLWWMADWVKFWWLRQTAVDDLSPAQNWPAVLGVAADYADIPGPGPAAWVVLSLGTAGMMVCWVTGRRVVVGLVVVAALLAVTLSRLGQAWPALEALSAGRAGTFAVCVFTIPAAHLLAFVAARRLPRPRIAIAAASFLPAIAAFAGFGPDPLPLGLTPDQHDLVAGLKHHTDPDARVLWEDPEPLVEGWNWSALLPELTGRAFLGGLDPEAGVEHSFCKLRGGALNGRIFSEWTAAERAAFVKRYNVGWVVCRSPAAVGWWASDPTARVVAKYHDRGEVTLFALDRPKSFVLRGGATIERADRVKIVLTDLAPDGDGRVVLSLHHQPGFRASPASVLVSPDKDIFDPVPMLALTLPGPTSRVVLVWTSR